MNCISNTFRRSILVAAVLLAPLASAQAQEEGGGDAEESADDLTITEVQVGTNLENGLVSEPQTSISRTAGRIYAVIRLRNPSREATTLRVAIERVGASARGGFSLDIPARRRYRTVARFPSTRPAGQYRVVVRSEDGRELSSVDLTITE